MRGDNAVLRVLFMSKKTTDKSEYLKKDKDNKDWDTGHTISDMSADWMPWNRGMRRRARTENSETECNKKADKREYRYAVWGQFLAMLPALGCIVAAFVLMYFLLRLWLGA